jgi:hypothetical protein
MVDHTRVVLVVNNLSWPFCIVAEWLIFAPAVASKHRTADPRVCSGMAGRRLPVGFDRTSQR